MDTIADDLVCVASPLCKWLLLIPCYNIQSNAKISTVPLLWPIKRWGVDAQRSLVWIQNLYLCLQQWSADIKQLPHICRVLHTKFASASAKMVRGYPQPHPQMWIPMDTKTPAAGLKIAVLTFRLRLWLSLTRTQAAVQAQTSTLQIDSPPNRAHKNVAADIHRSFLQLWMWIPIL